MQAGAACRIFPRDFRRFGPCKRALPLRLLVTRPQPDAEDTARQLQAMGHEAIVAPLISIALSGEPLAVPADAQALLFTSANGVRAFAGRNPLRDIRVFCVGAHSAMAACEAGFSRIECANGDVGALARLTAARCAPKDGPLVHIAGRDVAGDLKSVLEAEGFTVVRLVAYAAETATALPGAALAALQAGAAQGILFYSARTAAAFREAVTQAGLAAQLRTVRAYALSDAVAAALAPLAFAAVLVAPRPQQAALLALLDSRP